MSVRWYLLGLVLAALLPVLLFSAAMLTRLGTQERAALERQTAERAARIAHDVDAELQHWITALEVLALSRPLAADDLGGFYRVAARVRDGQGWANIVLTGPDAEHLLNLRAPLGQPLPPLNRPDVFLVPARSGRPYVSNVVPGLLAGRNLTVVTVPVLRGEEVRYVLAAAVAAPRWESFLRSRLASGAEAMLIDRNARVISRTLGGESVVGREARSDLAGAMAREPTAGTVEGVSLEGVETFSAYFQAPLSGWTVSVFMPLAAIEGPVRTSLLQLGGGFGLLLLLSLVLAWVIAQRIARSMGQLTASVRAVGDGAAPLPVAGHIAEVATANRALEDARATLQAADRSKEDFLAMLGHELRNPLAPINASLYILEQEERPSDAARRAATVIARQVGHLTRLLDDLLDVTRIARGKVTLRRQRVSLNEIVRRAAEDYTPVAQGARIALALELPDAEIPVHGDATRLAQILGNLLQNAVKFSPAGGTISVCLARRGDAAEIRVRDAGRGLEPELLERLFRPFAQGRKNGHRTGLGLGLALVRGLAELHGGSAHAISDGPGKGAEFVVTLPTARS